MASNNKKQNYKSIKTSKKNKIQILQGFNKIF